MTVDHPGSIFDPFKGCLFIHLFNQYFLRIYHIPGTSAGGEDTAVNPQSGISVWKFLHLRPLLLQEEPLALIVQEQNVLISNFHSFIQSVFIEGFHFTSYSPRHWG